MIYTRLRPSVSSISSKIKCCALRSFSSKSKVPPRPISTRTPDDISRLPQLPKIDLQVVEQLERISLVEFSNETGLMILHKAVSSANLLNLVDTTGVEPLDSVLEDRELWLREDQVTEGDCQADILSNAVRVEEQYFVAPPGNIALKKRDKQHLSKFWENEDSNRE